MQYLHWFIDPIKNKYADFTGRATRQEFWMYILIYFIIYIVLSIVKLNMLAMLFSLALLVPSLAIGARRLHDVNMSGWWQLIGLIPLIGLIVMIVFTVKEGDVGANQYGPSPKGSADGGGGSTPTSNDSAGGPTPAM